MKVIIDLSVTPIGVGTSLSKYVAACQRIFDEAGLNKHLHAYGTNIEGEWDTALNAIKRCHEELHEMGAPRISTTIRLATRIDKDEKMLDRVASVEAKLANS